MSKVYVGIDVGLKGFICVLDPEGEIIFHAIPVKNKNELDLHFLNGLLKGIFERYQGKQIVVGVEGVHAIFGASAGSTFSFGYVAGAINAFVVSNGVSLINPKPKEWQKEMWRGISIVKKKSASGKTEVTDTKATSIKACQQLYPGIDLRRTERCTKIDDNKCDSLLIATFLKRKNM